MTLTNCNTQLTFAPLPTMDGGSFTGYVLFESSDIVIIATVHSDNPKTGDMVQVWVMPRFIEPHKAVQNGMDSLVCFNCPARPSAGDYCYVVTFQGALSIHRAYQRGNYAYLPIERYDEVFSGRQTRFGAYGETVLIPVGIMEAIRKVSKHTGYTHQWRRPEFQAYKAWVMASVESPWEQAEASAMGWRTFRIRRSDEDILPGEIMCPASDEAGHRTQCERCLLCDGSKLNDRRKNIVIIVHGQKAKKFIQISLARESARA